MIEPSFTHNAIPVKLSDLKEIHDDIEAHYKYAKDLLFSLERNKTHLQFQTFYMAYTKNKYDRKVSIISSSFYDLIQTKAVLDNKKKLFVINTGSKDYRPYYFQREIEALQSLFPEKTKYELDGNNTINNIINDTINNTINNTIKNENIYDKINKTIILIIIFLFFLMNMKQKLKNQ